MIMNQIMSRPTSLISLAAAAIEAKSRENDRLASSGSPPLRKRSFNSIDLDTTTATATTSSSIESPRKKLKKESLVQAMAAQGASKKLMIRPSDYAKTVFKANTGKTITEIQRQYSQVCEVNKPTIAMVDAYTKHGSFVLNLIRKGDLQGLKEAHAAGIPMHGCNRYGESLLHLACRRGFTDIVQFLLDHNDKKKVEQDENSATATVSNNMLHVRDDYLRTPLHDACWTVEPNLDLVDLLLQYAPEQVVMEDVRGNTPLDYVRKDHYSKWLRFVWERKSMFLQVKQTREEKRQES